MNDVVDLPWCIIGDSNELANPTQKKGGKHYPLSKFARLNTFMDRINIVSVPYRVSLHVEKSIQTHLIYERLDRAIIQNDWVNLYPDSILKHGTFLYSDHCPIILSVANPIRRRKNLPF